MKEMLTKSFWQGVKKTYEDALHGVTPKEEATQVANEPESSPSPEPPVELGTK